MSDVGGGLLGNGVSVPGGLVGGAVVGTSVSVTGGLVGMGVFVGKEVVEVGRGVVVSVGGSAVSVGASVALGASVAVGSAVIGTASVSAGSDVGASVKVGSMSSGAPQAVVMTRRMQPMNIQCFFPIFHLSKKILPANIITDPNTNNQ